jgi:hypothetical protein
MTYLTCTKCPSLTQFSKSSVPEALAKEKTTNYRTYGRSVVQHGSAKGLLRHFVRFRALTAVILESVAFWVPTFLKNMQPEVCRSP